MAKNLEFSNIAKRAESFVDDATPITWKQRSSLTTHQNPTIEKALKKEGIPLQEISNAIPSQKQISTAYQNSYQTAQDIKKLITNIKDYSQTEVDKHYMGSSNIISSVGFLLTRLANLDRDIATLQKKIKTLSSNRIIRLLQKNRLIALNTQVNNLSKRADQIRKNLPVINSGLSNIFVLKSDFLVYLYQNLIDIFDLGARHQMLLKDYEKLNVLLRIYMFTRYGAN